MAEILASDLERHRRQRKQTGVSDVTINHELTFLRHLYTMASAWGKATEKPVKKCESPVRTGCIRMLNLEEEGLLLAQCASHLKPLIITALHTEFRASELLSLTWADVDFSRRVITVSAAYVKNGERRCIPMNDVLTTTLQTVKMEISEGDTVFRTPQGRRYRRFRTAFEPAVQRAGLMDFTFHDLRHILASRFYNSARTSQKTNLLVIDFLPLPGWWNGRHNGLKIRRAVTPVPVRVLCKIKRFWLSLLSPPLPMTNK